MAHPISGAIGALEDSNQVIRLAYNQSNDRIDQLYSNTPLKGSDPFLGYRGGEALQTHRNNVPLVRGVFSFLDDPFERRIRSTFTYPDPRGAEAVVTKEVSLIRQAPELASLRAIGSTDREDIDTINKMLPSIVRVTVESEKNETWYGSGVVVEPVDILPNYFPAEGEYFILTNNHVAEDARYLSVKLNNGTEYMGEVVESKYRTKLLDKGMDIALVRVFIPYPLPTAEIGDPSELEIGQKIFTAGHPRALPNVSITKGIISNPAQETGSLSLDIQSDAPINPGNSGGPSFTDEGKIIGLNTYTFRGGEDLTFTKPIDKQIEALRRLYDNGVILRGGIGITLEDYNLIDRKKDGFPMYETGAKITEVKPDSTAAAAGLKAGDIITWMEVRENGTAVKMHDIDVQDFFEAEGEVKRWIADLTPGTKVNFIAWRKEPNGLYSTHDIEVEVELLMDE